MKFSETFQLNKNPLQSLQTFNQSNAIKTEKCFHINHDVVETRNHVIETSNTYNSKYRKKIKLSKLLASITV